MARKTNKTSHVLNLITNGAPTEPETTETEAPAAEEEVSGKAAVPTDAGRGQEPASLQNQAGDKKVIVVDASENDKISDAIRERLEEQVEREAEDKDISGSVQQGAAAAVTIENGRVDADVLIDAADSMMPEAADMMTKAEAKAEAAAAAETEAGAANGAEAAAEVPGAGTGAEVQETKASKERHYHMVNVMEEVVSRYKLLDQMRKYGVCTCSRCFADVQALTLTHLPSKYVVVDGNPIAPIIGYYESKYRSRILTEVMKACILVKDKPRHNRNNVSPDMLE